MSGSSNLEAVWAILRGNLQLAAFEGQIHDRLRPAREMVRGEMAPNCAADS